LEKRKKIFYIRSIDPYLAKSLSLWTNVEFLESALYEWIVQSHLKSRFREIYYYRNSYEIDVISDNLKIEIKSKRAHRNYPKNIIILDERKFTIIFSCYINLLNFIKMSFK